MLFGSFEQSAEDSCPDLPSCSFTLGPFSSHNFIYLYICLFIICPSHGPGNSESLNIKTKQTFNNHKYNNGLKLQKVKPTKKYKGMEGRG